LHLDSDNMRNAIGLQIWTRVGRAARIAVLLVLTIALTRVLAVIFIHSAMSSSTPVESTPSEKNDTHKTGPWVYDLHGTAV
jgi:hypothetical protein